MSSPMMKLRVAEKTKSKGRSCQNFKTGFRNNSFCPGDGVRGGVGSPGAAVPGDEGGI